jgi:flagellar hook-associated protein 1 FlgK
MSGLLALLSQSGASLGAHRAAASTASGNIQNANTPGYARQRAEMTTLPSERFGGSLIGSGAMVSRVSQARDRFIEAQLPEALGASARTTAEAESLTQVSALDMEAPGGLSGAISAFYSELRALSQNPSDPGIRQSAVGAARGLSLSFNRTAQSLDKARVALDEKVSRSLDEVNALASKVADLNRRIGDLRSSGTQPNDLLDSRQKAMDRLSELTGAVPVPDERGNFSMVLSGGSALVSEFKAGALSALPDPANGGHLSLRLTRTDGSTPTALPTGAIGGSLGGYIDARDGALKAAESKVDALAFDLAGAVNTVHRAGFGLDRGTGRNLFDAGAVAAGAARRMQVNANIVADPRLLAASSTAAGVPGNGNAALSLIATERSALPSGSDPGSTFASIAAGYGASASRAKGRAEYESGMLANLEKMRESASGVSIDEELLNMTRAQKAFEAVGKVINTTNEMLNTLMQLK